MNVKSKKYNYLVAIMLMSIILLTISCTRIESSYPISPQTETNSNMSVTLETSTDLTTTMIRVSFSTFESGITRIDIVNSTGYPVMEPLVQHTGEGYHSVSIEPLNFDGKRLKSGIYMAMLQLGNYSKIIPFLICWTPEECEEIHQ